MSRTIGSSQPSSRGITPGITTDYDKDKVDEMTLALLYFGLSRPNPLVARRPRPTTAGKPTELGTRQRPEHTPLPRRMTGVYFPLILGLRKLSGKRV